MDVSNCQNKDLRQSKESVDSTGLSSKTVKVAFPTVSKPSI